MNFPNLRIRQSLLAGGTALSLGLQGCTGNVEKQVAKQVETSPPQIARTVRQELEGFICQQEPPSESIMNKTFSLYRNYKVGYSPDSNNKSFTQRNPIDSGIVTVKTVEGETVLDGDRGGVFDSQTEDSRVVRNYWFNGDPSFDRFCSVPSDSKSSFEPDVEIRQVDPSQVKKAFELFRGSYQEKKHSFELNGKLTPSDEAEADRIRKALGQKVKTLKQAIDALSTPVK